MQKPESSDQNPMTVEKAGKKGGDATFAKYGSKHYREIGKKGGSTRSDRLSQEATG